MKSRELHSAKDCSEFGLQLSKLDQVQRDVTFEGTVRVSNCNLLGAVRIGLFSYLGPQGEIKNTEIGRFCSIAVNVAIGAPEHPVDWVSSHPIQYDGLNWFKKDPHWEDMKSANETFMGNRKRTKIGHDVWIGRNAVIRQGVTVGNGSIIGANAFVNKDVPPYTIVGGVPAKQIRRRFPDELCEGLEASGWWNYKLPTSIKNEYSNPEVFLEKFLKERELGTMAPLLRQGSVKQVRKVGQVYTGWFD